MPFYIWDPSRLSVAVDEMDKEHQALINKMNAVYDAHMERKPRAEMDKLVDDFVAYTIAHFKNEEAYMEKIAYSGLGTHKIVHKQLLGKVTSYVDEFKKTGKFGDAFFEFLSSWLTTHILGVDTRYSKENAA